jgi:hypothetical protein
VWSQGLAKQTSSQQAEGDNLATQSNMPSPFAQMQARFFHQCRSCCSAEALPKHRLRILYPSSMCQCFKALTLQEDTYEM